jgi:hypothetical protein
MSLLPFTSKNQRRNFELVLSALADVGYSGDLIRKEYRFNDWFAAKQTNRLPSRTIDAALFGRVPVDYETALIGVAMSNGEQGAALANANRALGAPLIVEVGETTAVPWAIGHDAELTRRIAEVPATDFLAWVQSHRQTLRPPEFLRAKNVGSAGPEFYQPGLFAGLIPELEGTIAGILGPRLTRAFASGWKAYEEATGNRPREPKLFQLAFWLLTGKVFCDRKHPKFANLSQTSGADEVLNRVAEHYRREPENLLNRQARDAVFDYIWSKMDFQNLSVEVLSQLWSTTLVTPETRKKLGIHRTRRSLVRYIIDRIPFEAFSPDDRYVFEPCSGSAAFLVAAMERLHDLFPEANHSYFRKRLSGLEKDPFGIEISKLCLSLADYPNPNGWKISPNDVFDANSMEGALAKARVVLCNPPFEPFSNDERSRYGVSFVERPAELLSRVLASLHPDGVLGFVLPRTFVDGQGYRSVRGQLVKRFRDLHILSLPDRGWEHASKETVALIATSPKSGTTSRLLYRIVKEPDWKEFDRHHRVRSEESEDVTPAGAETRLMIPELREVWQFLADSKTIDDVADAHRGIEWNKRLRKNGNETGWRSKLIRSQPFNDGRLGVPPREYFRAFETPPYAYLDFSKEHRRRNSHDRDWHLPKVIMNSLTRSRGPWRLAAFVDVKGVACSETYTALWPKNGHSLNCIASVIIGPIANAFVACHEDKSHVRLDTIRAIPWPAFQSDTSNKLGALITTYKKGIDRMQPDMADRALREIDAIVLDTYGLPRRLERALLDFFNGYQRQVPFHFANYFPSDFGPYFSLSEWLTGYPAQATAKRFRSQNRDLPDHIIAALAATDEGPGDDE